MSLDSSWWKRLSSVERVLAVSAIFVLLVCLATTIGVGIIMSHSVSCTNDIAGFRDSESTVYYKKPSSQMCETPACVIASAKILENMDKSVNPCDDFYKFACGNFLKKTSLPDNHAYVGVFSQIDSDLQVQLRESVEGRINPRDSKSVRLVKNLYKSCMDQKTIEKRGVKPLLAMIEKLGGWPVLEGPKWDETSFNWMESVFKFRDMGLPTNFFIGFRIDVDMQNTSSRRIYIDQPSLELLYELLVNRQDDVVVKAYHKYMVEVAVLLGAPKRVAEKELRKSLQFEEALAAISLSVKRHRAIAKQYNPMTLKELSQTYPSIPWKTFLDGLLTPRASVNDNEKIIVRVPGYLSQFPELIQRTPRRVQADYAIWRAIATSIVHLNEDLRRIQLEFEMTMTGKSSRGLRWKECIQFVTEKLPLSMGSLFVQNYFDEDAKKTIATMCRDIKNELNIVLQRVEWMDAYTRKNALRKTSAMTHHVAYPNELLNDEKLAEYYGDLEMTNDNYLDNALDLTRFEADNSIDSLRKPFNKSDWTNHGDIARVNAFYSPFENSIQIPAGILQGRVFDRDRPRYMNYAGIGFIIGHELTHGFDDIGRYFDKEGNIVNWWSESAEKKFSQRVGCIIVQYDKYWIPDVHSHVDGSLTRNENIADNGGVKLAYLAYTKWAREHRKEESLPGLHYTPQQMFWISMANTWCTKYRSEFLKYMILEDPHSPSEFRVRGPFSNMVDFANDFKCSVGEKMNPRNKCGIW